jgi:hypothetical protein
MKYCSGKAPASWRGRSDHDRPQLTRLMHAGAASSTLYVCSSWRDKAVSANSGAGKTMHLLVYDVVTCEMNSDTSLSFVMKFT